MEPINRPGAEYISPEEMIQVLKRSEDRARDAEKRHKIDTRNLLDEIKKKHEQLVEKEQLIKTLGRIIVHNDKTLKNERCLGANQKFRCDNQETFLSSMWKALSEPGDVNGTCDPMRAVGRIEKMRAENENLRKHLGCRPGVFVNKSDLERIASFCHSQWSGWMKYLFSKCERMKDGSMNIPAWAVDRWTRQMMTTYENLSEKEKDSDRKEARGFFKALREAGKKPE